MKQIYQILANRGDFKSFLSRILSMSLIVATLMGMGTAALGEPIDLGSRRELFIDHYLIEELQGTSLKLHHPQAGGIAVKYDGPTDGIFSFYTTILKDGDLFRMYYRGYDSTLKTETDWTKSITCYAESRDGIHWTKPALGIVEINGSKQNNAILPVGGAFCPFLDNRPGVPPSERYKANMEARNQRKEGKDGLVGYVSGDGIHWKLISNEPIVESTLDNHFDSQNVMFWSEVEQKYLLYARHTEGGLGEGTLATVVGKKRATARATSSDFLHWSDPVLMTYSDTGSTVPSQHLYTNQTTPYFRAPHIYISLPGRLQQGRRALSDKQGEALGVHHGGGGFKDIADGVLLTSRSGTTHYDFTFRESFVRPGIGNSNWTSRNNYPALGVVPTGPHEMSIYVQRNYGQKSAYLERMTLRTDGFASVNAPYDSGEFVTKAITFTGKNLVINYAASAAGGIQVEIQNEKGRPISGYTLEECSEIIGDEMDRIVMWENGDDVSELAGKPVRLKFQMKDADLFSIQFRP